ncbi:MAG: adenylate/guanylate cyclase domain-containing protein [Calditrichaeota bacterium]|nr:adenylate/guanylate cyclase domain-containing protein [Calditrichota bacterium]
MKAKSKTTTYITSALLIVPVALVALLLSLLDFFQNIELTLYDRLFQYRGARSIEKSDIALVVIDEPTADSLSFPFDRRHYATLVYKLKTLGARWIAFDIGFSSRGANPVSDSLFKAAITEAGNVIHCAKTAVTFHKNIKKPLTDIKPPVESVSPPGTPWGLIDDLVDPDGVTRRYPLFWAIRDTAFLSLGMKIYALDHNINLASIKPTRYGPFQFGSLSIPRCQINATLLNYYGPSGTFPTYSFYDVISGAYDFDDLLAGLSPEEAVALQASGMADMLQESPFKDKIVLVGASAEDLQDNKFTPFFSDRNPRKTPGVEVHANALQMLKDGKFLVAIDFWWVLAGILVLSILTHIFGRRLHQGWAALITLGLLLLIFSGGIFLFIKEGLWLRQVPLLLTILVGNPTNLAYRFVLAQREKALYRGMFSQYVQKEVVDELISHPELLRLGGERRRMTALFTDVAGFSTISEKLQPEDLVHLLNEYLSAMSRKIVENKGIIDKYEGDLIMAEFGAPIWTPDHAANACRAGLNMQNHLKELRTKWKSEGKTELYSRVGINTGDMLVGNMGSDTVFDYTVMGDAVNLASRLEGANKAYGSTIMIGQNTYDDVKDLFVIRPLDLIRVKGKNEPVAVYELLAEKESELSEAQLKAVEFYRQGIELFRQRKFPEAWRWFENALETAPTDGPSKTYLKRCELYIAEPPPDDWDGVWTLTEK